MGVYKLGAWSNTNNMRYHLLIIDPIKKMYYASSVLDIGQRRLLSGSWKDYEDGIIDYFKKDGREVIRIPYEEIIVQQALGTMPDFCIWNYDTGLSVPFPLPADHEYYLVSET